MVSVYVGIGSNCERYRHIVAALDALQAEFGELRLSTVYESEAIGFEGDHFLNMVAGFQCELSLSELAALLRGIEYSHGRPADAPKLGGRTIDIDILTYGQQVGREAGIELPRGEITENAFVLRPLSEVAPQELHPELKTSYADLWQAYDQASQKLWSVEFRWRGRVISSGA